MQADLYMNISVCKLICTWISQSASWSVHGRRFDGSLQLLGGMKIYASCWGSGQIYFYKSDVGQHCVTLVVLIPSGCWTCRNILATKSTTYSQRVVIEKENVLWFARDSPLCELLARVHKVFGRVCCSWPFHSLVWRSDCAHSHVWRSDCR